MLDSIGTEKWKLIISLSKDIGTNLNQARPKISSRNLTTE